MAAQVVQKAKGEAGPVEVYPPDDGSTAPSSDGNERSAEALRTPPPSWAAESEGPTGACSLAPAGGASAEGAWDPCRTPPPPDIPPSPPDGPERPASPEDQTPRTWAADNGYEEPPAEVGGLLEQLNHSANEVNELEQELVKTQKAYERNAVAWSESVTAAQTDCGEAVVLAARPYYHGLERLTAVQGDSAAAAERYRRAALALDEAKANLKSLEAQLPRTLASASGGGTPDLGRLNAAIQTVVTAQIERDEADADCSQITEEYRLLSQELETWRRDNPATLESARPVFELHEHYGEQATGFMAARTEVRKRIRKAKAAYSAALQGLEDLSNAIHRQRAERAESADSCR